jgi:hypothetical protein
MIKVEEVSPEVKSKVVRLFDREATLGVVSSRTLRLVATGLAAENLKLYSTPVDNLTVDQLTELHEERTVNFREYLQLARDIYLEATVADIKSTLGEDVANFILRAFGTTTPTSTPDATGNDQEVKQAVKPNCGIANCPICN